MKVCATILFLLFGTAGSYSQVTQDWVRIYNSPGNLSDLAGDVAVDAAGNIYISGYSGLDPNYDYNLIKYNPDGQVIWVKSYDFANLDNRCYAVIVDNEGSIYITGESKSTSQDRDIATIKYDSSGTQLWVQRYNGATFDLGNLLAVDGNNNIYVGGRSGDNAIVIKYNSSGAQQWAQTITGTIRDLTVDNNGNVYTAGYTSENSVTIAKVFKYNTNGSLLWSKNPLGTLELSLGRGVEVDSDGNVFVVMDQAGNNVTVKYNSNGVEQWVQTFQSQISSFTFVYNIAVDQNGNCFLSSTDRTNSSTSLDDITTIKYSADGNQLWTRTFNGPDSRSENFRTIRTDNEGNVYTFGEMSSLNNLNDLVMVKYSSDGDTLWMQTYSTPVSEYPINFTIDNNYNIYATGSTFNQTTLTDRILIKYSQPRPPAINKPAPYSKFIAGEKDTVKWTDPGWVSVNIKCKTNFGTPIESEIILAQGLPNLTSEFIWNMPDTLLSFRSKIIIENANNITEKIESVIFRIKPYVLTRLNSDSTYYEYRKNRDQWGFSNTPADMWPATWYNQFNYSGTDPFTNLQYSQVQGDSVFTKIAPTPNAHTDWVSWVNTFGVDACYFSTLNGWYKPSATIKWWSELDIWNGSCFGIAVANALSFSYREQFRNKYPNFPAFLNPITVVSDTGVKRVVNELYTHQLGNPHLALRKLVGLEKTPNETLNDLKEMLAQDNSEIRTLSFLNNGPGGGGHAVLAYGLKKDAVIDGLYYVQIYDNSNPNSNNHIQLNSLAGNGFWAAPDWAGWGGNKWLYLRNPTQQYLLNPTLANGVAQQSSFILGDDVLEVNNTTSVSIQIQDNIGNQTGFKNNLIQLDIPGSIPLVVDNGSKTPPYGYSLPANNYGIVLNEFAEETIKTFFFTGNKSFVYERSGASQTETDRLFFDGGVSATNPDTQTKTVKISNLINEITQEKLFVARSLELTKNDSVKIENPDSNKVKIISYGTAKNYDIELNYVTENEFGRFVDSGVSLAENSSHTFIPVWTELTNSKLQVLVDIGNDGTIDDTLSLVNQVTGIGDNQGLLLSPNSYNLAQNYPNPFNPVTTMQYSVPQKSHINLTIYDILGNEVKILINEQKERGVYTVNFDASGLASGMYICQMRADSFSDSKKMILLK